MIPSNRIQITVAIIEREREKGAFFLFVWMNFVILDDIISYF